MRKGPQHVLETLGVPKDPRGIVLLCGYVAACALGLIALLTPPSDPITNATPVAVTPRRKRLSTATPARELPMTAGRSAAAAFSGRTN